MIPKKIHYCWYGGKPLPEKQKEFIRGWKTVMPDYQIKCWNENNTLISNKYLEKAFKYKQWANVSNFVRLNALSKEGGIYFDTDVEVLKRFDPLIKHKCFLSFESKPNDKRLIVNNAIIGSVKNHHFINKCIKLLLWTFDGHERANKSSPILTTCVLKKYGLKTYGERTINQVSILPNYYFYPYSWNEKLEEANILDETFAIHHWHQSWKQKASNSTKESILGRVKYHLLINGLWV